MVRRRRGATGGGGGGRAKISVNATVSVPATPTALTVISCAPAAWSAGSGVHSNGGPSATNCRAPSSLNSTRSRSSRATDSFVGAVSVEPLVGTAKIIGPSGV